MNKDIGSKLKEIREKNNYSQEKLSEYLGISRQQLHKYETGVNRIPIEKLESISKLFKVDLNYFSTANLEKNYVQVSEDEKKALQILKDIKKNELKETWLKMGMELVKVSEKL